MKRIIINALQYKKNSSGIGVMIRELFGAYAREFTRDCSFVLTKDAPPICDEKHAKLLRMDCNHSQGLRRIWHQSFSLGRLCKDAVLLTTDSKVPLVLPRSCKLMPLITDLAVFRMPHVYQFSRVLLWKMQYIYLCRRTDHFLAVSEFTKGEMMNLLGIPSEKIDVIPCACDWRVQELDRGEARALLADKYDLPEKYILFVGNSNPRKNLQRMIRAFDMAKDRGMAHHLVIAGEQGWKFDREQALKDAKHTDSVHFIGFVPDEDMRALYSASDLFAFPTLYEGFGIPVLEAQACGVPVLTSNCSSLPEVGGDSAVYVDPYDAADICAGMLKVIENEELARELIQKGFENTRRFSWKASAKLLDEVINKIEK